MLVFLEDKQFYRHNGINIRGIARAILGKLKREDKGGGSSITQQIVRTLFIVDYSKIYRRKIIEVILALWLNSFIDKDEQLRIYISSVRYENNIFGISKAMKYFFHEIKENPTPAEVFFLIERVSNIHSKLLEKVATQIINTKKERLLNNHDVDNLLSLYDNACTQGKIKTSKEEIRSIAKKIGMNIV